MAQRLVLNAKLDTSNAGQLRDELVAANGKDVVLDAAQVDQLGALCAEVLMSAKHLWAQQGKSFTIESPSPQLVDNLGRMGFSLDDIVTGEAA